jgi:cobalamin biosynthesis Mg chelatase CobN
VGNDALKYDLKRRIHGFTQGDSLVATYFHKLRNLWQELDHYQNLQPMCAIDATQIKKMIEEERIYEFLCGLNSEYDPVRVHIFGKEPLPSLQEVFSYIQNEESRRSTMFHSSSQSQSALVRAAQCTPSNSSKFRDRDKTADATSDDKDKLFCDHCNRSRHTRGTCWKLHGRPARGRGGHIGGGFRPRAHHTSTVETTTPTLETSCSTIDTGGLSKDEVEALH